MNTPIGFRLSVTICAAILFVAGFSFMSAPTHAEGAAEKARKAAEGAVAKAVAARTCKDAEDAAAQAEDDAKNAEEGAARAAAEAKAAEAGPGASYPDRVNEGNMKRAAMTARSRASYLRQVARKKREAFDAIQKPCDDPEKTLAAAEEALRKAEELLAEKIEESGNKEKPPKKLKEEKDKLGKLRKDLHPPQGTVVKPSDVQASVITKASDSTRVINFDTSVGRVVVNLPDDMMAGDTISGTVIAEPKGTNEDERRRNLAELSGFVVELKPPVMANTSHSFIGDTGNNRIQRVAPPSDPNGAVRSNVVFVGDTANNRIQRSTDGGRTWQSLAGSTDSGGSNGGAPGPQNPPRSLFRSMDGGATWQVIDSNSRAFTLRLDQGQGGVNVGLNRLTPEDPLPGRALVVTTIQNNSANRSDSGNRFTIPTYGQQGQPILISGPFDGDFQNTNVMVKDSDARVLTESPREITFQSPANIVGPLDVVIREGNVETKGTYRNVGVKLTAPKTNLLKGEKTELKIEVSGLQGIKEPVPLTLESRGVITMQGGMYQPLLIQPSQVSSDGSYSTTRGITGVQAGGWSATATVVTTSMDVKIEDQNCDRRLSLNSSTGEYSFNCPDCSNAFSEGASMTREQFAVFSIVPIGRGTVTQKDCIVTLEDNATDRRVMATIDRCTKTGSATVEVPANKAKFTITDRNSADNTCPVP
jgi:hypothetical protein